MKSARWYLPSLDPADGEDKVSTSVEISCVVYIHSSTVIAKLNSFAADFKRCMATLAQSITAAATDLALGIVQRRSDIREGMQDSILASAPAPTPYVPTTKRMDDLVLETPVLV